MTTPTWPDLSDITEPEDLLRPIAEMDQQLKQILTEGPHLMLVTWRLADATEKGVDNPATGKPVGFFPLAATNVADNAAVEIAGWKFNLNRADKRLGITVDFSSSVTADVVGLLVSA